MAGMQWGRLQADLNLRLRRGAWYRVVTAASLEVVLDVHGRDVSLPRPFVEITGSPPRRWTVVARPPDAVRVPPEWGTHYAVCPRCRERQPLERTTAMRCRRCTGRFEIARSEAYLAVG